MLNFLKSNIKPILLVIKAVSGTLGIATVIMNNHPYTAAILLAVGAAANEAYMYVKQNESKAQ